MILLFTETMFTNLTGNAYGCKFVFMDSFNPKSMK